MQGHTLEVPPEVTGKNGIWTLMLVGGVLAGETRAKRDRTERQDLAVKTRAQSARSERQTLAAETWAQRARYERQVLAAETYPQRARIERRALAAETRAPFLIQSRLGIQITAVHILYQRSSLPHDMQGSL